MVIASVLLALALTSRGVSFELRGTARGSEVVLKAGVVTFQASKANRRIDFRRDGGHERTRPEPPSRHREVTIPARVFVLGGLRHLNP